MAGGIGWPPSETRGASLAELWASWIGFGRVNGWFDDERPAPMTRERLGELIERYPDVRQQ